MRGAMSRFVILLVALSATAHAQTTEPVPTNRHATGTLHAPLPAARSRIAVRHKVVSAESAPKEAETRLREAGLSIKLGDTVPLEPFKGPRGPGPPSHMGPTAGWLPTYDDARFGEACAHYLRAAQCSSEAAEVVMAHAATTSAPHAKVRVLRALRSVSRDGPSAPRTDRVLPPLLALCLEPEPVSTEAVGLLELWCAGRMRDLRPHVDGVLQAWPADREVLRLGRFWSGGCCSHIYSAPANTISRLVLIMAASGDARVVDRLLFRPPGKPHPSEDHVDFVLFCLAHAAKNVDLETARRLHDLFLPELQKVPDAPLSLLPPRQRALADLFVALYPRLPADLLPRFHTLFECHDQSGSETYRDHFRSRR
jgi:hypothetical protein